MRFLFYLLLLISLLFSSVQSLSELPLLSEQETHLLMKTPQSLQKTYFLLLCYQKDIKCEKAEHEILNAIQEFEQSDFSQLIQKEIEFRRVECIMDFLREICTQLGHSHYLKPARIQIIASSFINHPGTPLQNQMLVYKFSSPLQSQYIKKKTLMFTIHDPAMIISGGVSDLKEFDDVKVDKNIVFALKSADPTVINLFEKVALIYKERFFFFVLEAQENEKIKDNTIHAVGNNFTKNFKIMNFKNNPAMTQLMIEKSIIESQGQDLLFWNYTRHIQNQTYLDSLKDKLIVVGLAGKRTEYLTADFLNDFRNFVQQHRYSLDMYEFAVIDIDDEDMFNYLITYSIGRFDSPGVFIIKDINRKVFYRNYETYNGKQNFKDIAEGLLTQVNLGQKHPLYANWIDCYQNLYNLDHWNNNRLKAYMYFLGISALCVIPMLLIVDLFFPILGRGPRPGHKTTEDSRHSRKSPAKEEPKQTEVKNEKKKKE